MDNLYIYKYKKNIGIVDNKDVFDIICNKNSTSLFEINKLICNFLKRKFILKKFVLERSKIGYDYLINYYLIPFFIYFLNNVKSTEKYRVLFYYEYNRIYLLYGSKEFLIKYLFSVTNQKVVPDTFSSILKNGGIIYYTKKIKPTTDIITDLNNLVFSSNNEDKIFLYNHKNKSFKSSKIFLYNVIPNKYQFENNNYIKKVNSNKVIFRVNFFGPITMLKTAKVIKTKFFNLYKYISSISMYDIRNFSKIRPTYFGGIYVNKRLAKIKAYVEAVERFSSGVINLNNVKKIKFYNIFKNKYLKRSFIDPKKKKLTLNSNTLHECIPLTEFKIIDKGYIKLSRKEYFPVEYCYYPYQKKKDSRFTYANSSGCAGHDNYYNALKAGIFELSERDSFVNVWLNKISPNIIDNKSLPAFFRKRIAKLEDNSNYRVTILDISLDKSAFHIAVMIKCKEKNIKKPYFRIGMGCELIIDKSIDSALREIESFVYYLEKDGVELSDIKKKDILEIGDHLDFYYNFKNFKHIQFLFEGSVVSYDDLKKLEIKFKLPNLLKSIGGKWYGYDLTNNFSKNSGVKIVRVISTELLPIWFGKKNLPLFKKRLHKIKSMYKSSAIFTNNDFLHPMG